MKKIIGEGAFEFGIEGQADAHQVESGQLGEAQEGAFQTRGQLNLRTEVQQGSVHAAIGEDSGWEVQGDKTGKGRLWDILQMRVGNLDLFCRQC